MREERVKSLNGQKGRNGVTLSIQLKGLEHNTGVSAITSYAFIFKSSCILQKHTLKITSLLGEKYSCRSFKSYNQSTNKNISISTK